MSKLCNRVGVMLDGDEPSEIIGHYVRYERRFAGVPAQLVIASAQARFAEIGADLGEHVGARFGATSPTFGRALGAAFGVAAFDVLRRRFGG